MKIIDRYIGKIFAISYLFTFLSVIGFYVVVDLVGHIDEFLKNRSVLEAFALVARYYVYTIPIIFLDVSPVITLMAAMFALVRLIKANEHIPLMSSGISLRRAMLPIFVLSFGVTGLIVLVQEVIVPNNAVHIADMMEFQRRNRKWMVGYVGADEQYNLTVVSEYQVVKKEIYRLFESNKGKPTVWVLFRDKNFNERKLVQAKSAKYERNAEGHKRWFFYEYVIWRFDDSGLVKVQKPETGPVLEIDADEYGLKPEHIRKSHGENLYLSTAEIIRRWNKDPRYIRLGVLANSRIAYPFLNIILLMVGIPFILIGDSSNAFRGIGRTLLAGALLFIVVFIAQDLGNKGDLSPLLAAWLPIAMFGAVGILLMDSIRT